MPNTNNRYHYYVYNIQASELLDIYGEKVNMRSKLVEFNKEDLQNFAEQLLDPPKKLQAFGKG